MTASLRPKVSVGALVIALTVAAAGIGVVAVTAMAPASPIYSRVGPAAFPYGVGVLVALLGLLLLRDALKDRWRAEAIDQPDERLDYKAVGFILAGFVAAMALLTVKAGFMIAATALFLLATIAFGERRWWLSLGIGFAIAFVTYVIFAKLLGLRMGTGLIERFF